MSYADMAKKGPKQTDEEMPDTLPEIQHEDLGVRSIDSMASYADQQKAAEDASAASEAGKREADEADKAARDFMNRAEASAQDLEEQGKQYLQEGKNKYSQFAETAKEDYGKMSKDARKKYEDFTREAGKDLDKAKREGKKYAGEAKEEGKKFAAEAKKEGKAAEEWTEKNKGNPVVVGNAVVVAALAGLLGTQGYRMHQAGTLTWKVAGAWAGVVGLFAVGDYYVSQWLFKNKYPPKQ